MTNRDSSDDSVAERVEAHAKRYHLAAHRVQTAIGFMPGHSNQTPKHLRVGVDMQKSDLGGLAGLLIGKGVITLEEYTKAIADQAELEAEAYEKELSAKLGVDVKTI